MVKFEVRRCLKMDNRLKDFDNCIVALRSGSFILMSKGISDLLKTVVASEFLTRTVTETRKTFSYEEEFKRARVPLPEIDGEPRSTLALPEGDEKRFTFITYLLSEMDIGKRDPFRFLSEYFYSADKQSSYERFCNELLSEYSVCAHNIAKVVFNEADSFANKDFFASSVTLANEDWSDLYGFFNSLYDVKAKGSVSERSEFNVLVDAAVNAIRIKNARLLSILAISLKFAMKQLKISGGCVSDMIKLLESKNLI